MTNSFNSDRARPAGLTVRDQIEGIGLAPTHRNCQPDSLADAEMPTDSDQQQTCVTARKIFSCLNFPLKEFTHINQKTALIEKNLADNITVEPLQLSSE